MSGPRAHPRHPRVLKASTWWNRRHRIINPSPPLILLIRFVLSKLPSQSFPESQLPPQGDVEFCPPPSPRPKGRGVRSYKSWQRSDSLWATKREQTHQQTKASRKGLRAPLTVTLQPWPRSASRMTGQVTEGDSAPA